MKMKLAAQTFSSSTAVALQFLQQKIKHKKVINCTDTIVFVRNIDCLTFKILDTQHHQDSNLQYGCQILRKKAAILEICNYLLSLKDPDMYPLHSIDEKLL